MASLVPQSNIMFFKVSIVNKSFMRAFNCTFQKIQGTFLYVSGSSVTIDGNTTLEDMESAESESEIFLFDNSQVIVSDTNFNRLSQLYVTPILRF